MAVECFVPDCPSSLTDDAEQLLFVVPNESTDEKRSWFASMGVDLDEWTKQRETDGQQLTAYVCQDHFNLIQEMTNSNDGDVQSLVKPGIVAPDAEDVLVEHEDSDSEMVDPLSLELEDENENLEESSVILGVEDVKGLGDDDNQTVEENDGKDQLSASPSIPLIRIKAASELISKAPSNPKRSAASLVNPKVFNERKQPVSSTQSNQLPRKKQCIVPDCPSSTENRPENDFVCVPMTVIRKKAWMEAITRAWTNDVAKGIQHCCVDHFNDSDLEEYTQNPISGGGVTKRRARDGVLPSQKLPGSASAAAARRKPAPKSVLEARKRKMEQANEPVKKSHKGDAVDPSKYRSMKLCRNCFELFENEASYQLHLKFPCIQNRPAAIPTKCEVCYRKCSTLAALAIHVETVHRYICIECDHPFSEVELLRSHIQAGCINKKTAATVNGNTVKRRESTEKPAVKSSSAQDSDSSSDVVFVNEEKLGETKNEKLPDEDVQSSSSNSPNKGRNLRQLRRTPAKFNDNNFETSTSVASNSDSEDDSDSSSDTSASLSFEEDDDRDWRAPPKKKGVRKRRGRPPVSWPLKRRALNTRDNDPDYDPIEKEESAESDPDDPDSANGSGSPDSSSKVNGNYIKLGIATCWKCKKRFKNLPALKSHMQVSPGCKQEEGQSKAALQVQCKSCKVFFTSSLGLGLHLKRSKSCMKNNPGAILPGVLPSPDSVKDDNDDADDSDSKVFLCQKCNASFTSVWGLRTHERNSKTCKPDKPYAIPVPVDRVEADKFKNEGSSVGKCGKKKQAPTIVYTPRAHDSTDTSQFKCKNCKAVFTSVWGLRTHERISLKCGKSLKSKVTFDSTKTTPVVVYPATSTSKASSGCVCNTCHSKFSSQRGYSAHLRLSSSCGGGFGNRKIQTANQNSAQVVQKDESDGVYVCPMCRNSFVGSLEFTIHFSEHGNLQKSRGKYNCFVCQKKFGDVSSLYRHVYCDHVGEWFCPICSFNFNSFKLFFEHINGRHNNGLDNTLRCVECLKSFTTLEFLKWHSMNCPPPPKPTLSCYICAKKFLKKMHITNHIKYRHMNLGADDKYCHQCSKCPRLFPSEVDLAVHSKEDCTQAEELVKCDLCPSSFLGRVFLKKHINFCHPEVSPTDETEAIDAVVTIKEEFTFVEIKEEPVLGMVSENEGLEFEAELGL